MLHLAQLPDPSHFASVGWVVVILFFLVKGSREVLGLVRESRPRPSADEVAADARGTYVTRDHCLFRHATLEQRIATIEDGTKLFRAELRQDLTKINDSILRVHERLDPLVTTVAQHEGKLASTP